MWLGAEVNSIFLRGEGAAARPLEVDTCVPCRLQRTLDLQQADGMRDSKISNHPYSPTSILLQYIFKF